MKLEPPQPPTAPAPAIRPTPPTPPRIDKGSFAKEEAGNSEQGTDVYEDMARDAVAHGSGALTKRTVDRGDNENPPANQTVTVIPPDAPLVEDTQSDYDRGQDVLREFREMDARETRQSDNSFYKSETEQQPTFTPKLNHQEGHGGAFWIFTIIFVAVAAFVVAKKFLFTDKPALTKSQLFDDDAPNKLKATADKKTVTPPPKSPPVNKKNDDKSKHFEVRI